MANSHTLGTCSSPRMRWADIEVPNLPVDVSSWGRSACYPRRTFYPLSDGPSTQNHRITMTDFRLCSTCTSYSQASLCHYTQHLISIQIELTFVSLRYSLGGDRPSQTTHQTLSSYRICIKLAIRIFKGGISRLTPIQLASYHHRLPPILHMNIPIAVSSYSKGARGLSVFPRVGGIFTSTTISLDPPLRQLPSRYAIHAGRYLTDKEFRYLRTVIVTAAVYSGFDQMLHLRWHHQLTFEHRAGVTPYTSTYVLAKCCVFGKQSGGTLCCNLFSFLEQVHIPK